MSASEFHNGAHAPTSRGLPSLPRAGGRLETIALAVILCVPVPVFAATGLSLPLPNVVERIAAALVPWADPPPVEMKAAIPPSAIGKVIPSAADANPNPSAGSARVAGAPATEASPKRASRPAPNAGKAASGSAKRGSRSKPAHTRATRPTKPQRIQTAKPEPTGKVRSAEKKVTVPASEPAAKAGGSVARVDPPRGRRVDALVKAPRSGKSK